MALTRITGREEKQGLDPLTAALVSFYEAFANRNLERMEQIWTVADDARLYNPVGGVLKGWREIRDLYRRLFEGPTVVSVTFYDFAWYRSGSLACVAGRERGEARRGERVVPLEIRTSRLLRLDEQSGRWEQVHHHGSIDNPCMLAAYQELVRGESQ